jgi:hypothetical protein
MLDFFIPLFGSHVWRAETSDVLNMVGAPSNVKLILGIKLGFGQRLGSVNISTFTIWGSGTDSSRCLDQIGRLGPDSAPASLRSDEGGRFHRNAQESQMKPDSFARVVGID